MLTSLFYPLTFLPQNRCINKEKPQNHYDSEVIFWQRVKDSNPHIQSQSLLCYHYTNPLFVCLPQRTDIIIAKRRKMSIDFLKFFGFF